MAVWGGVVLVLLLVPLVAMQFTREVRWGLADFIVAGALLFGAGLFSFVSQSVVSLRVQTGSALTRSGSRAASIFR